MTPKPEFYYARKPSKEIPATSLVGPFPADAAARAAIRNAVRESVSRIEPCSPRHFRIFRLVDEVEAVVTPNVTLKAL